MDAACNLSGSDAIGNLDVQDGRQFARIAELGYD
jgi:hypothetical protein